MRLGDDFPSTIQAAQRGDREAIAAIYRVNAPMVRGYFVAQRAPDPDDLTGDVFVSMMGSLGRFEGDEAAFRAWLLTIAHRRLVDAIRRRTRRPEALTPYADPRDEPLDLTTAEAEAMSRLRSQGIVDAIDQLTPDQRAVLLLRAVADLPVKDIALVVDKPETAVKALLHRAAAAMRRTMRPDDVEDDPTPG